jgi:hypothetical protein
VVPTIVDGGWPVMATLSGLASHRPTLVLLLGLGLLFLLLLAAAIVKVLAEAVEDPRRKLAWVVVVTGTLALAFGLGLWVSREVARAWL